jgi:hypothetical protein
MQPGQSTSRLEKRKRKKVLPSGRWRLQTHGLSGHVSQNCVGKNFRQKINSFLLVNNEQVIIIIIALVMVAGQWQGCQIFPAKTCQNRKKYTK